MRTSLRRGLSAVAALALIVGSALAVSPAYAAVDGPVVDITSPTAGSSVANFTLLATVTDDDLDYWTVVAQGPEFHAIHTEANPLSTPLPSPASVNLTIDTSTWLNGSYLVSVNGVDQLDHISTGSVQITVTNGTFLNRFDTPTNGEYISGDVHVSGQLGSVFMFASYSVDGGAPTTLFTVDAGDSSIKPFDFTLSGLEDGPHSVTVYNGPGEASITRYFTVDSTPPVISVPAHFWTTGANPIHLYGSIYDDSQITYTTGLGRYDVNFVVADYQLPYSGGFVTLDAYTDSWDGFNDHYFAIYAVDAAGNSAQVNTSFGIDTDLPTVTIAQPDAHEVINPSTVIKGKATDGTSGVESVDLYIHPLKPDGTCKLNTVIVGPLPAVVADGKWSLQLGGSTPSDGSYCLRAVATDYVGHQDTARRLPVETDSTAPATPEPIGPEGWVQSADTLSWTGVSDEHGVSYQFALDTDSDLSDAEITDTADTEYVFDELLPDTYWWKVRAVDGAGNKSDWSDKVKFDVIGVPIVSLCGCGFFSRDLDIDWTGVNAPGGVKRYEFEMFYEGDPSDSGDDRLLEGEVDGVTTTFTRHFGAALPQGVWSVRVRAVYENRLIPGDPDSKFGPWSEPVTAERDSVRPAVPVLLAPTNDFFSANDDFDFSWASVSEAVFYEFRYNQTGELNTNGHLKDPGYTYTCEPSYLPMCPGPVIDSEGIPEGEYWWQVRAYDEAENRSRWSDIRHVTVDFTAPTQVTLLSLANGAISKSKNVAFGWSPVSEGGVTYQLEASRSSVLLGGGTLKNALHGSSVTTSLPLGNLTSGTWYWHVRAVDRAGNVGPWSELWTMKVVLPAIATTGSGEPAAIPTAVPTDEPSDEPTAQPTDEPTDEPIASPSDSPEAAAAGESGFPVWVIIGIIVIVLAGGGFLIRFLFLRRA